MQPKTLAEQVNEAKDKLRGDLQNCLDQFEIETGISVRSLHLESDMDDNEIEIDLGL